MKTLKQLLKNVQVAAVVCNQWGDSGKGKLVDWIASEWADVVVRGTGGGNAGHTIKVKDTEHICHTVPCGILNQNVSNNIGSGVAFDPRGVLQELREVEEKGFTPNNLAIAYNAKLILPQHIVLDRIKEAAASGGEKIGTTGRGIGPVYTDHYARVGLVVNDMLNKDVFVRKLRKNLADKVKFLEKFDRCVVRKVMQHEHLESGVYFDQKQIFDLDAIVEIYLEYGKQLKQFICDADQLTRQAVAKGKKVLLEGAQGHMLSIDYGTYPFVTSSDCSIPGLAKGSGLNEKLVDFVLGVVKAPYMTRVGQGPFPTELGGEQSENWCATHTRQDEENQYLNAKINNKNKFIQGIAVRKAGGEYGATTGRPRRTGWLDLPLLRYAMITNGPNIALTKLQIFDDVKEVQLCRSYTYHGPDYNLGARTLHAGETIETTIPDIDIMKHCEPNYITLPGWKGPTQNIKNYNDLPKTLRDYVFWVEQTGAKARVLSMGPERNQTIVR